MDFRTRAIQTTDEEFLFRLYASTRAEELALVEWSQEQKYAFLMMQYNAQRQQYQITYPDAFYQIIEYKDAPVGRLIIDRTPNETVLVDIALLPDFRNMGLGTSILRSLQEDGLKIVLHVIRSNPAVHLYQRLGFVFVGEEAFYSTMEWSPAAARHFPWAGLCIPSYRSATLGNWSLKREKQVAQFGYFQDWQGQGDIAVLNYNEKTWMSTARDEIDSQTPHIAAAFGHTVLMGAGLGIALYNLLLKKEVTRVTLVEKDPRVIEILKLATDLERWPGIEKLRVEITDALDYLPDQPVDHLYADIWASPGEQQSIPDMQRIQANVNASETGWWGQELLFLEWLNGKSPTQESYRLWAKELSLPLIEQDDPDYPDAVEQVSRSYCYRMFVKESARAKSLLSA